MKIIISADSTCDLPLELVEKFDIKINAMPFLLGEDERHDGVDGNTNDVFEYVDKTGKLPTTSAFNVEEYKEHFAKIANKDNVVIHFGFSSKISSTCKNAQEAAKEFDNVYVVDTLNASCGMSILITKCFDMIESGKSVENILSEINLLRKNVRVMFLVDNLKHLHKGGRCSSIAKFSATLFSIKPKIEVIDGEMLSTQKFLGNIEKSIEKMIDQLLTKDNLDKENVFIVYSTEMKITDKVIENLKKNGFKNVYISMTGPSISIHCGKNTFGICCLEK